MANPFMVVDPIDAMVGTQKSLADIGFKDAQTEMTKAHTALYAEQAEAAKAKMAKEQAVKDALKGGEPADLTSDPFKGEAEQLPYKNTVAGEVPVFLRMIAKAQDYDKQAQKLRTVDFDAYMKVAKEREK